MHRCSRCRSKAAVSPASSSSATARPSRCRRARASCWPPAASSATRRCASSTCRCRPTRHGPPHRLAAIPVTPSAPVPRPAPPLHLMAHTWGAPTLSVPKEDRFRALFVERSLPGCMVVNAEGRRFLNESCPYPEFQQAMFADHARSGGEMGGLDRVRCRVPPQVSDGATRARRSLARPPPARKAGSAPCTGKTPRSKAWPSRSRSTRPAWPPAPRA